MSSNEIEALAHELTIERLRATEWFNQRLDKIPDIVKEYKDTLDKFKESLNEVF